jgi:hypothetical protein
MKTKWWQVVFLLIAAVTGARSQGILVPNGVTFAGSAFGPASYGIKVAHNPTGSETTGFGLAPIGITGPSSFTNTFGFDPLVDVGVRVFITSFGQAITADTLLSGGMTELTPGTNFLLNNRAPVYLALYTGNENFNPPNGVYSDPLFGWAFVEEFQGVVSLISGAIEYGGAGIDAGTQTIIEPTPEPGTLALAGMGGLLLGWRRWKR